MRTTCVYGGTPYGSQEKDLRSGVDVVVGTTGRLIDHLDRKNLRLDNIKFLVLDEADEMLNMGFQEDVEKILSCLPDGGQGVQKCLFSATIPPWVQDVSRKFLHDPITVDLVGKDGSTATATTVRHLAIACNWKDRISVLPDVVKVYGAETKVWGVNDELGSLLILFHSFCFR